VVGVEADADAAIGGPTGGGVRIDQRLQRRHAGGEQGLPLPLRDVVESGQRFGGEAVGEHRLLDVRRRIGEDVGDAGAQVVADVAGEKSVGALAAARRDDAVANELHVVAVLDGESEPAQLV